jgi:hypothetical protein
MCVFMVPEHIAKYIMTKDNFRPFLLEGIKWLVLEGDFELMKEFWNMNQDDWNKARELAVANEAKNPSLMLRVGPAQIELHAGFDSQLLREVVHAAGRVRVMLTLPNPENVYLACGPIDLRKSIDSLAALVQEGFGLDPFAPSLFVFCIVSATSSIFCSEITTASGCCIAGWSAERFNGRPAARESLPSHAASCAGCWTGCRWSNAKRIRNKS